MRNTGTQGQQINPKKRRPFVLYVPFVPYASPFVNNQPQESKANELQTSSSAPLSNRGQESGLMIY
jgi:hypothetical protein